MELQIVNFLNILHAAISENTPELSDPDWNQLYDLSKHHSILPLYMEGCNKYKEYQVVPEEIRNNLMLESIEAIIWQAGRTEAFLMIYDKLIEAGLRPLVLKGLICRSTYQELADHRPSLDEDLYIPFDEFEHVKDILTSNGFQMEDLRITEEVLTKIQAISFVNHLNDLHIDVHLNPVGCDVKHREKMIHYFRKAFDNCISYQIKEHKVYSLNHTGHFLYLFLHFYRHFTGSGVGIRQLLDLLMYDRSFHKEINWLIVESIIIEMSADKLYSDVLEIGRKYLSFSLETDLKGYDADILLEDMMSTGTFRNHTKDHSLCNDVTTTAVNYGDFHIHKIIFPKSSYLVKGYPILNKRPYLLPFVWITRLFKFIINKNGSDSKIVIESIRIGKRRVMLLKKYGILN